MEVLNHAIEGLPPDRIHHVCWGAGRAHTTDVPLQGHVDLILKVKVGAYVIEGANRATSTSARYEGCEAAGRQVLIPSVISHATAWWSIELVAERIGRYARLMGAGHAGGNGLWLRAGPFYRQVHPSIMGKLDALAPRAASREWN